MSIWNKVLLWLIGLASLGFIYLAARTLQTHAYWMDTAQKLEKSIERVKEENRILREGDATQPGIAKLRIELHKLLVDRPKIWANCPTQVNIDKAKNTATILAGINMPTPHGIAADSRLYAFEQPANGNPGRYLGEFNVTKAEEKQILLEPAFQLGELDKKNLSEARAPWTFYDSMPQSPLRDYAQLLDYGRRQNTILYDEIEAATRDKAMVEEGLADAQRQVQFAQNLMTELKSQLAKKTREVDSVAKLRKLLEDKLASITGAVDRLIEENKAMAGQIAQKQLEATRRIDARTRAMAQNGGEK
jgi:hypothetical protein